MQIYKKNSPFSQVFIKSGSAVQKLILGMANVYDAQVVHQKYIFITPKKYSMIGPMSKKVKFLNHNGEFDHVNQS